MPTSDDVQGFDPYLVTQIGLDSGALTRLAVIVHAEPEVGRYRGTVGRGKEPEAAFSVSVDKDCAAAGVEIDLARLVASAPEDPCGCSTEQLPSFVVHPKGFIVFRVSSGAGGFHVNLRKADEDPERRAYDTQALQPGDTFSGVILRPGRYSISNALSQARGELRVPYPVPQERAYTPPPPFEAQCGEGIEPGSIDLQPLQGLNLRITSPARVRLELEEPDDGPSPGERPTRAGWKKASLPLE
jgi:hypothetical protein